MPDPHMREVENYTTPFLAMMFVIFFTALFTLWAMFGYVASLLSGLAVHLLIDRLPKRD